MSDLFDPDARAAVIARLQHLQPDAQPRWGRLTPDRMLVHLIDSFHISFGEKTVTVQRGFLSTALGRWLAVRMPIPRGKITAPPMFHETEPEDFAADRQRVIAAIDRFAAGPDQTWGPSPLFGALSGKQWARLHLRHVRHHCIQFGV